MVRPGNGRARVQYPDSGARPFNRWRAFPQDCDAEKEDEEWQRSVFLDLCRDQTQTSRKATRISYVIRG